MSRRSILPGAGESFVSFIALFGGCAPLPIENAPEGHVRVMASNPREDVVQLWERTEHPLRTGRMRNHDVTLEPRRRDAAYLLDRHDTLAQDGPELNGFLHLPQDEGVSCSEQNVAQGCSHNHGNPRKRFPAWTGHISEADEQGIGNDHQWRQKNQREPADGNGAIGDYAVCPSSPWQKWR
jgi:hypothetical protein